MLAFVRFHANDIKIHVVGTMGRKERLRMPVFRWRKSRRPLLAFEKMCLMRKNVYEVADREDERIGLTGAYCAYSRQLNANPFV